MESFARIRLHLSRRAYRAFGVLPFGARRMLNRFVNDTFLVGLLGVVRNESGEVLVLRHTYRPTVPFGVPSGWLKSGESLDGALQREIGLLRRLSAAPEG